MLKWMMLNDEREKNTRKKEEKINKIRKLCLQPSLYMLNIVEKIQTCLIFLLMCSASGQSCRETANHVLLATSVVVISEQKVSLVFLLDVDEVSLEVSSSHTIWRSSTCTSALCWASFVVTALQSVHGSVVAKKLQPQITYTYIRRRMDLDIGMAHYCLSTLREARINSTHLVR